MGIETGFIKLGVSDLVGDLRDVFLALLGLSISYGVVRKVD